MRLRNLVLGRRVVAIGGTWAQMRAWRACNACGMLWCYLRRARACAHVPRIHRAAPRPSTFLLASPRLVVPRMKQGPESNSFGAIRAGAQARGALEGTRGSSQACVGMRRRVPLSSLFLKLAVDRIELASGGRRAEARELCTSGQRSVHMRDARASLPRIYLSCKVVLQPFRLIVASCPQ